jgi:hypothetical protein
VEGAAVVRVDGVAMAGALGVGNQGTETVSQRQSSPPPTYLWQGFQRLMQQVLGVVEHHVDELHVQAAVGRRQLAPRAAVLQQGRRAQGRGAEGQPDGERCRGGQRRQTQGQARMRNSGRQLLNWQAQQAGEHKLADRIKKAHLRQVPEVHQDLANLRYSQMVHRSTVAVL